MLRALDIVGKLIEVVAHILPLVDFSVHSQLKIWPLNDNVFRHGISRFLVKALLKSDQTSYCRKRRHRLLQKVHFSGLGIP
jgi:hypothetical protein